MPAGRDARGRFISSNQEDPESVEENREPEQSDSVNENRESEQTEGDHDDDDAAEQILFEMAGQTARTTNHPVEDPEEIKPVKLLDFKTSILARENVRTWRSDVEEFCQIQGVWKAVQKTLELQDKPEELARLLANQKWASLDATAKYYIKQNLKQEDKTTVRDYKNSGAVWKYLMSRYERTTQYDIVIALRKVIQWKKDSKMGIEDSLQQLEQLNAELYEISDKKNRFDELMILTIFLEGLPMEFDSIRDALFGSANLERGLALSRLHQKELKSTVNAANETAGWSLCKELQAP
ncbi:hypothetical protein N7456_006995 [Penicillium angulare]|uniref:Uncharacterized protein n=1 Tax=Penicillium angulare TaxID=116970 RepID=A0A9W9FIN9_9EURO|nr:hypothetical protein N7456_006793 [Penicillium angulare]KAJ5100885.1 hypothetical protein N7456_006937 [Penicillium angulare]KAJ5100916.1 hypothetical protein N7456_006968 [Penicillium angulare]KAJ5100943.1 hypothetical protein N7456_006995 [Penicillium angulare]